MLKPLLLINAHGTAISGTVIAGAQIAVPSLTTDLSPACSALTSPL